jgi:hypothetical protein
MAETDDQQLVFHAPSSDQAKDDVWDDSLLTEAFEKQQRLVEQALKSKKAADSGNGSIRSDSQSSHSSSKVRKVITDPPAVHCGTLIPKVPIFAAGDPCRCVYSADGVEYEANIVEVFQDKDQCLVRYVGYENEELQNLSAMKVSHGAKARIRQTAESQMTTAAGMTNQQESELLQMPSSPEPDITPVSSRSEVTKVISSIADQENKKNAAHAACGTGTSGGGGDYQSICGNKKKGRASRDKLTNESIILPYKKLPDTAEDTVTRSNSSPQKVTASSAAASFATSSHSSICPPPLPPGLLSGRSDEDDALASMLMSWYMSGYHTGFYEAMKKYHK